MQDGEFTNVPLRLVGIIEGLERPCLPGLPAGASGVPFPFRFFLFVFGVFFVFFCSGHFWMEQPGEPLVVPFFAREGHCFLFFSLLVGAYTGTMYFFRPFL